MSFLGQSESPGKSKEKLTNSPFTIWSSSFFGKLGVSSEDMGSKGACSGGIETAISEGLCRSKEDVQAVYTGKLSVDGGLRLSCNGEAMVVIYTANSKKVVLQKP